MKNKKQCSNSVRRSFITASIFLLCLMTAHARADTIINLDSASVALNKFQAPVKDLLLREILSPAFEGVISAALVKELIKPGTGSPDTIGDLMIGLLPLASHYALPPISHFRVGAISQGKSGALYLGANLEIASSALGFTLHAEQSAVNNALVHGESDVLRIAVTAAPCGHCRQFLNELDSAEKLEITVIGHEPMLLSSLLPRPFGPKALGIEHALLSGEGAPLQCNKSSENTATCQASELFWHSYAPYSGSPSSIVLLTNTDSFAGTYVENAAFNPSLSPILSALDRMRFSVTDFSTIQEVVLFELKDASISQASFTRAILGKIAPSARFRIDNLEKTTKR